MSAPKVKFLERLAKPVIRKRDGAEVTHCMRLHLTTDEALLVSAMFTHTHEQSETAPTFSLFRTALNMIAEKVISESSLLQDMAKWRLRESLAVEFAGADFNRCLSYLDSLKQPKPAPLAPKPTKSPTPEPTKKVRREYVFTPDNHGYSSLMVETSKSSWNSGRARS